MDIEEAQDHPHLLPWRILQEGKGILPLPGRLQQQDRHLGQVFRIKAQEAAGWQREAWN